MDNSVTSKLTHSILSGSGIGLWAIEIVGGQPPRMYADETMLSLLGVTKALTPEAVYRAWYEHIDPEYYDEVGDAVERMTAGARAEVQYPWYHPMRGKTYVRSGGMRNYDFTEGVRLEGCHREISDLIKIHKKADRLQSDVEMLVGAVKALYPVCFNENLTHNSYRVIHYYDSKGARLFSGGSVDELITVCAATIPDEEISAEYARRFGRENLLALYRRGVKSVTMEHPQFDAEGFIHWMQTTVVLREDEHGNVCAVSMSRNIDDKHEGEKALRDALEQADAANTAKMRFLMNMSHDLRTPLNAVEGFAELAVRRIDDRDRALDALNKALAAASNLQGLTEDILTMSSLESGAVEYKPDLLNVRAFFEEMAASARLSLETRGIEFTAECDADKALTVIADEEHLREVLFNLFSNAVKFTPDGGRIALRFKERRRDERHVKYALIVEDSGRGMKSEFLSRAFEPFTQESETARTRYEGSGLGLAITKKLVELMGGAIDVQSAWHEGSTFTVTLNFELSEGVTETAAPFSMEGLRLMLVEDNLLNMEIARELLEDAGCSVVCAENGKAAVESFAASFPGSFDAILMDIMMPVLDGNEAARAIRGMERGDAKTVPIIALSANAFPWDIEAAKAAGMDAHLSKPLDFAALERMLAELIRKKG